MVSSDSIGHISHFNNSHEEIKYSLCTVVVTCMNYSQQMCIIIDESMYDNLPTDETCRFVRY
jgi:hypothetical protein